MTRALLAALFTALVALSPAHAAGEVAPDFTLRDINGKSVSLSAYKGQVVLMNFWATWCGPCQVEMPHLQAMQKDLAAKGFTVLSVSADDARTSSQVKPLIMKNGYTFPVVLDTQTSVVAQYNPAKALPYTVLIDKTGHIRNVHQGYNPGDEKAIRAEVEALLAEAPAP